MRGAHSQHLFEHPLCFDLATCSYHIDSDYDVGNNAEQAFISGLPQNFLEPFLDPPNGRHNKIWVARFDTKYPKHLAVHCSSSN